MLTHGKRDTLSVSAESLTAASASVTSAKSADSGLPSRYTADAAKPLPYIGDMTVLLSHSDKTSLPCSRVFRDQKRIGSQGAAGARLSVGMDNKGRGEVYVTAHIKGKDGQALTLNGVMQGVQAAIGQLIDENKDRLPLIVTPAQIYRAYARLDSDAKVMEQQAAQMEQAMDTLMYASARVDFTEQLEKHKNIKKQKDYDYTGEKAGSLEGHLIAAVKGEATNRKGERKVSYKVYDYPLLYWYSHVVGQIAQVPNKLLTGDKKGDKGAGKTTAKAQRTALNMGMRRNVVTRIEVWRGQRARHKTIHPLTIRVQEVANDCRIVLTDKTRRTLRKNIQQYFDELKAQGTRNGGIKDYKPKKAGRRIDGFAIEL